jgi:hypothetical protein
VLVRYPGIGGEGGHVRWARQDIEALAEGGFIRLDRRLEQQHDQWEFDITDAGFEEVDRRVLLDAPVPAVEPADEEAALDWNGVVLPVLRAVYAAYPNAQRPELGVDQRTINAQLGRDEADPETARVLEELVHSGYLEMTMDLDQLPGPAFCRLSEKGLRTVAGWPSADAAVDSLLAALDERIATTESEGERGRLRAIRDSIGAVSRDVVADVLAKVITGQM